MHKIISHDRSLALTAALVGALSLAGASAIRAQEEKSVTPPAAASAKAGGQGMQGMDGMRMT